jgi:hypothetical protein
MIENRDLSIHAVCALALALGAFGCTESESVPLPRDTTLITKCLFAQRGALSEIAQGDVFLYAVRDESDGTFGVVTGIATTSESLFDVNTYQSSADILPARLDGLQLRFGGLDPYRIGESDHWISASSSQPGELTVSIGTTYGTAIAYPMCVYWELIAAP